MYEILNKYYLPSVQAVFQFFGQQAKFTKCHEHRRTSIGGFHHALHHFSHYTKKRQSEKQFELNANEVSFKIFEITLSGGWIQS